MKTFSYVIKDPVGIHARPAGMLVKKAGEFQAAVTVKKGDKTADARRLFSLMGLAAKQGDTLTIEITGADEEAAAAALQAFLEEHL